MPIISTLVLYAREGNDEPTVFAGVSSMDCVNQAKQFLVDVAELGRNGESENSREAFNAVGLYCEFKEWLNDHYCYYTCLQNDIVVDETAPSPAVKMLAP